MNKVHACESTLQRLPAAFRSEARKNGIGVDEGEENDSFVTSLDVELGWKLKGAKLVAHVRGLADEMEVIAVLDPSDPSGRRTMRLPILEGVEDSIRCYLELNLFSPAELEAECAAWRACRALARFPSRPFWLRALAA